MTTPDAAAGSALGAAAARLRVAVPSVADRVAAELRLQLAEGLLLPGARLTESTIAEELGVSRNTVREAFAELAAERLAAAAETVAYCYAGSRIVVPFLRAQGVPRVDGIDGDP